MRNYAAWIFPAIFLAFVAAVFAAPVPPPRPVKPVSLVGGWRMIWGSATWEPVGFAADGYYACGQLWEGRWKFDGRTLTVTEWQRDSEFPATTWSVEMTPGKREGKLQHGMPFRLEFPTPPELVEEVIR